MGELITLGVPSSAGDRLMYSPLKNYLPMNIAQTFCDEAALRGCRQTDVNGHESVESMLGVSLQRFRRTNYATEMRKLSATIDPKAERSANL